MHTLHWISLCLASIFITLSDGYYTGAVTEYSPYASWNHGPRTILEINTKTVVEIIAKAANESADILVLPEYGITGSSLGNSMEDLIGLSQKIFVLSNPCSRNDNHHTYPVLQHLSCAAKDNGIYVVANLPEMAVDGSERVFYNTQVAFDSNGTILTRYRKKHLYFEPEFTPGKEPSSSSIFHTNFGETFSLMTSFDILYDEPGLRNVIEQGVKNIAVSAYWIDGLPFLTGPQIFSGWASGLNVTLLLANHHIPQKGGIGSGIFQGSYPPINSYSALSCPFLIIQNITNDPTEVPYGTEKGVHPIADDIESGICRQPQLSDRFFVHENLENYTTQYLWNTDGNFTNITQCHEKFCCSANYSLNSSEQNYRLISYKGIVGRGEGEYKMYVEICSVVFCGNESLASCGLHHNNTNGELIVSQISASFNTTYIYPSVLTTPMELTEPRSWEMIRQSKCLTELRFPKLLKDVLTATLYGRNYDLDFE